jgi:hypothetical protein
VYGVDTEYSVLGLGMSVLENDLRCKEIMYLSERPLRVKVKVKASVTALECPGLTLRRRL